MVFLQYHRSFLYPLVRTLHDGLFVGAKLPHGILLPKALEPQKQLAEHNKSDTVPHALQHMQLNVAAAAAHGSYVFLNHQRIYNSILRSLPDLNGTGGHYYTLAVLI